MKKKSGIKAWAEEDRPREKLEFRGKETLTNAELIAILIGSGNSNESAVSLAKRLLISVDNNLTKLSKLPICDLTKFKGIGKVKAIKIITALEFGKRKLFEKPAKLDEITSSKKASELMINAIGYLPHEEFWVLYLNNANKLILKYQLSKGGITATLVDIRLVVKKAIELSSVGLILCHNHPSGKLKPSKADIELTNKIKLAASTLDLKLLDHVIISGKTYFSFADEGIL